MKNQRGFTLVELMAVMVLLGVLSIIAVTSVTKYLKEKEQDVYSQYENTLETATENYLLENTFKDYITLEELIDKQYSTTLIDPENKPNPCSGYVKIVKDNTTNLSYKYITCLTCKNYRSENCD